MRGFLQSKTLDKKNYNIKKWHDTDFSQDVEVKEYNDVKLPARESYASPIYEFKLPKAISIFPDDIVRLYTDVRAFMLPDEYLEVFIMIEGLKILTNTWVVSGNKNIFVVVKNTSNEIVDIDDNEVFLGGIFHKFLTAVNDKINQDLKIE